MKKDNEEVKCELVINPYDENKDYMLIAKNNMIKKKLCRSVVNPYKFDNTIYNS